MADGSIPATDIDDEQSLETVVSGAVTTLTLLVGFGLLFTGVPYFWVVFPVGFGGVLPMALGLVRLYGRRQDAPSDHSTASSDDALATLRRRYAEGELTDAEFEHQVEQLLETESTAVEELSRIEPTDHRERARE